MKMPKRVKRALVKQAIKSPRMRRIVARSVAKRFLRPIPIIGTGAVLVLAITTLRRKGTLRGSADVALDLIPVVGLTKAVVEVFTGDLIPDKRA